MNSIRNNTNKNISSIFQLSPLNRGYIVVQVRNFCKVSVSSSDLIPLRLCFSKAHLVQFESVTISNTQIKNLGSLLSEGV